MVYYIEYTTISIVCHLKERNLSMLLDETIKDLIKKRKIITIHQLITKVKCSRRTVQRKLKICRVYTSYNCNGCYYTLPEIPIFDKHGIWRYNGVYFSKYGNLTQTVITLVHHSESGLAHQELCKRLGIPASSYMSYFRGITSLRRDKIDGRVIYFSQDENRYTIQKQHKTTAVQQAKRVLPQDADSILILVDRIKYPHSTLDQCARRLQRKCKHVTLKSVEVLLEFHGISEKKTTPDT